MAAWKGDHIQPSLPPEKKTTRVCCVVDDPSFDEFPTEFDEINDFHVAYEDKYCRLSADAILIKSYYFPSGKDKRIPLPSILSISNVQSQEIEVSTWGTIDCTVWWNYDHLRGRRPQTNQYFIIDCGDKLQKGFTCRRPYTFWGHLSRLVPQLTKDQPPPARSRQSSECLSSPRKPTDGILVDVLSE